MKRRAEYHLKRLGECPPDYDRWMWFLLECYALDDLSVAYLISVTNVSSSGAMHYRFAHWIDKLALYE
jgi:hypothetical protein